MNIVISGASSGIGYSTVKALAKNGEHQLFAIARTQFKLENLVAEVKQINPKVKIGIFSYDLQSQNHDDLLEAIKAFFALQQNNVIDILINNAGYLVNKSLMDTSYDDWEHSMNINAFSILKMSRMLFPYFSKTDLTHIVNIGSMGGVQGTEKFPGLGAYSASKAAVNSLTESMAAEWQKFNIHTNAINPGSVQTAMLEKAFPDYKAPISADDFGAYLANFALSSGKFMNGRVVSVSLRS
jgi:short-subunit dehydrogenase